MATAFTQTHASDNRTGTSLTADLLYDTIRTVQAYYIPMRSYALHTYHSAFITMPRCSLQQSLAQGTLPSSLPILISPRADHWGPSAQILEGHQDWVLSIAFSPDGIYIATVSDDHTVRVWNAVTFEELVKLEGHESRISSVTFSRDGKHIVSGSNDRTVRIWDAVAFEGLAKLEGHQDSVMSVAFSPDGKHIASGSQDLTLRIWNALAFEKLATLEGHKSAVMSVTFSCDGTRIASGSEDCTVRIWNALTFEEVAVIETDSYFSLVNSVVFSPDGTRIDGTRIASSAEDCTARIWNALTFEEMGKFDVGAGVVSSVAFSPDGTHIAYGTWGRTVRLCNAVTFEELAQLTTDQHNITRRIAFSLDGAMILSQNEHGTMRAWARITSDDGRFPALSRKFQY
jgi:WD40 repeat protein